MNKKKRRQIYSILLLAFAAITITHAVAFAGLANELSGRILLQVESKGEAWYVDPITQKRSYLGRPADAFALMRELGLGISNADISKIPVSGSSVHSSTLATQLRGRILLQVESKGEAWYVNPVDGYRYFLGRPSDAFDLMRSLGLGISNQNLSLIAVERGIPATSSQPNNQISRQSVQNDDRVVFNTRDNTNAREEIVPSSPLEILPVQRPQISHPISVIGDEGCQSQTQQALDLLYYEAREFYNFTVSYLGIIECTPSQSGVYVWESPVRFEAGAPTRNAGDLWYASVLAHESCHAWQYKRYPNGNPPAEEYSGADAEQECTAVQKNAAIDLNAPQSTIDYLDSILSAKWWDVDYQKRWW